MYIPGKEIEQEKTNFACKEDYKVRLELAETHCYMTDGKPTGDTNLALAQDIMGNFGNFD